MKDYYKILEVSRQSSDDEIKKSYRKLAFKYHPDRNNNSSAILLMKEINEAYDILSDLRKRENYNFKLDNRTTYYRTSTTTKQARPRTTAPPPQRKYYARKSYDFSGWAKIGRFVSTFILLYCGLIILDYFIAMEYKDVVVKSFTTTIYKDSRNRETFKIFDVESDRINWTMCSESYIKIGDTLNFSISPLFGIIKYCDFKDNGDWYPQDITTIYSPIMFVLFLSIGFAIASIKTKTHEQSMIYTFASLFFYAITFYLMIRT